MKTEFDINARFKPMKLSCVAEEVRGVKNVRSVVNSGDYIHVLYGLDKKPIIGVINPEVTGPVTVEAVPGLELLKMEDDLLSVKYYDANLCLLSPGQAIAFKTAINITLMYTKNSKHTAPFICYGRIKMPLDADDPQPYTDIFDKE